MRVEFPRGGQSAGLLRPEDQALGIYLVSYEHLPYERAAGLLSDWVGAEVSAGSLQAFVAEGAEGLEEFLGEIRSQLTAADVAHFDETGGRIEGRLGWIHSASTETLTLLTAHSKRGVEAVDDAGVLPGFRGTAVHDGWAPYRSFKDALHALRGAHHLRELVGAEEHGSGVGAGDELSAAGHQGRRR